MNFTVAVDPHALVGMDSLEAVTTVRVRLEFDGEYEDGVPLTPAMIPGFTARIVSVFEHDDEIERTGILLAWDPVDRVLRLLDRESGRWNELAGGTLLTGKQVRVSVLGW